MTIPSEDKHRARWRQASVSWEAGLCESKTTSVVVHFHREKHLSGVRSSRKTKMPLPEDTKEIQERGEEKERQRQAPQGQKEKERQERKKRCQNVPGVIP